ncbi:MAG: 50S ribosomal protein L34e [Thaumarchaeota archaeon]|nr:50S ribosomal protein L34e [Candidatus Calditenuaceae archaeon]MDW8041940.1 50S ribosomal protein L34e [Nitrososphaerota archaeon]
MPTRGLRVRSIRRVSLRTPTGRSVVHYEPRRPGLRRCGGCGRPISGVPRDDVRPLPKSQKRISRYHGGNLCHKCLERRIEDAVSSEWNA